MNVLFLAAIYRPDNDPVNGSTAQISGKDRRHQRLMFVCQNERVSVIAEATDDEIDTVLRFAFPPLDGRELYLFRPLSHGLRQQHQTGIGCLFRVQLLYRRFCLYRHGLDQHQRPGFIRFRRYGCNLKMGEHIDR